MTKSGIGDLAWLLIKSETSGPLRFLLIFWKSGFFPLMLPRSIVACASMSVRGPHGKRLPPRYGEAHSQAPPPVLGCSADTS